MRSLALLSLSVSVEEALPWNLANMCGHELAVTSTENRCNLNLRENQGGRRMFFENECRATHVKGPFVICGQRRSRSVCASVQSDLDVLCSAT